MGIKEAKERIDKLAQERKERLRKGAVVPIPEPRIPVEGEPAQGAPAK